MWKLKTVLTVLLVFVILSSVGFTCTIIAVGKKATVDGSAIITHNDDSSVADFRLWIQRGGKWQTGAMRPIVIDSHDYIDYSKFPIVDISKNRNGRAIQLGEDPQPPVTNDYFHSRYSFMNDWGVAMGESTAGIATNNDYGKAVRKALFEDDEGIVDCWAAQDIALERAKSAREAVQIMGDLIDRYGWNVTGGGGELINITDGNEVWVVEFYGANLWMAIRMPDDMVYVGANRMRFQVDPRDGIDPVSGAKYEEILTSANFIDYAVEKGWYDPASGKKFRPAEVYANRIDSHNKREWRVLDMVAPSLGLEDEIGEYPLFVKPDRLLSVHDIFLISGDHYEGTKWDLTKGVGAGPWGDPLTNYGIGGRQRPIGIPLTCYLHIAQVKEWLPREFRGISWYGYGSVGHSYLTPLFPAMEKLPDFYSVGSRYEKFRRDSGWWVNTYVQEMVGMRYSEAIKELRAFREPKMASVYAQTAQLQEYAAMMYRQGNPKEAVKLMSDFCYHTAVGWNQDWLDLGDRLFTKYATERINFGSAGYPTWWQDWLNPAKNPELLKYANK